VAAVNSTAENMTRIYMAGAYSGSNILQIFRNMQIGIAESTEILKAGMAPFCPWLDYQFFLHPGCNIDLETIRKYSIAWMEVSAAVKVVDNPANIDSKGLAEELEKARELGIPAFYRMDELKKWNSENI